MRRLALLALVATGCVSTEQPYVPPPADTPDADLSAFADAAHLDADPVQPCTPCAAGAVRTCGREGACGEMMVACADGCWPPCPAPFTGQPEICDGVDDDCDGRVDEGFNVGTPCRVGRGICTAEATIVCDDRGGWTCPAEAGAPSDEICGPLDEDCDGAVDEQLDCPVCDDAEVCNGLDDDCDGATDETFAVGEVCSVGLGACQSQGVLVCGPSGDVVECDADLGVPHDETCNGLDDDCDGEVDEVSGPCRVGVGACEVEGTLTCGDDGAVCSAEPGPPSAETCNGLDDDCDGVIDVRACMGGQQRCKDGDWLPCAP